MGSNQWGTSQEKEKEDRRKLLVRARKGDVKAQRELMDKYGMRVYSDIERSQLPTYYESGRKGSPPTVTSSSSGKSVHKKKTTSLGNAQVKKTPKQSRETRKA